ncbi:MAG: YfbK domain-containing protein [Synechococcus sp.]|nr:YfbK domain-containing protein [Synechococcus sp.]
MDTPLGTKPLDQASPDFRFAAAVAEFGMLLRDSPYRGESSFDQVLAIAQGSKGADPEGYRSEFIQLVKTAQALKF